jgi:hypothetical protein
MTDSVFAHARCSKPGNRLRLLVPIQHVEVHTSRLIRLSTLVGCHVGLLKTVLHQRQQSPIGALTAWQAGHTHQRTPRRLMRASTDRGRWGALGFTTSLVRVM